MAAFGPVYWSTPTAGTIVSLSMTTTGRSRGRCLMVWVSGAWPGITMSPSTPWPRSRSAASAIERSLADCSAMTLVK